MTSASYGPIIFLMEAEDAAGATTTALTQLELRPHESGRSALPLNSPSPLEMECEGSLSSRVSNSWEGAGQTAHQMSVSSRLVVGRRCTEIAVILER